MKTEIPDFQLVPVFSGEMFFRQVQYTVIVENWRKKDLRKGKKAYNEQFTAEEQDTIAHWNTKFEKWFLVTGIPETVKCDMTTLSLLKRAVHFFATV